MSETKGTYRTRRTRSKVAANQDVIIAALEAAGATVIDTSSLGGGYPDLTVIRPDGTIVLVEIKRQDNPKLTAPEVDLMLHMVNANYRIFTTPEQAAANITAWS